ncbi:class D beta-lactamase [Anabaena sp. PCC 7938]|uniref:beta-lactamase n=1 Tax=Anabaena cylindrica (strain ATCC 27899 / PCC 7122) TaxID=272123 RepID=K9ZD51_ANACC|nr:MULTISPECIES: class D beta-lactamase [Anabaena]AFZ56285.1 Beta-lactamase [Anabaena cylindrica PCC 7122]MCM2407686.1 class D beta-lactamase [Anabaena sp. CCAP 1446/1C]BAY01275.1 peptidoglycan glycosyltransferase [Anabaena cylindrica PCC 7122]
MFRIWRSSLVLRSAQSLSFVFTVIIIISLGSIYVQAQPSSHSSAHSAKVSVKVPDLGRHFQKFGVEGSIIIYDSKNNLTYEHNPQRNATAMTPASTFKIFNALTALETGVIADDVAVLTWDGIHRDFEGWNQDTNLRQAFKNSTVWFYQVLARRIGYERMQQWIDKVGYGNRQIGTAADIDRFWLQSPLKITPKAQINFLQRLYAGNLPFTKRTMDVVKDIMVREQTPDYTLRAKTGWSITNKPQIGWFVGYLEQNKNVYFFATNIDINKRDDLAARIEITRSSLKDIGLL